ncbi:uncharacterized protein LOC143026725 [Oratosquilla oratoria]|uniref:uncharacterized protein LOC143026725 n=1 Tax=Oratosquilla oratoria TaxID=337810 RepID=UPI003F76DFA5
MTLKNWKNKESYHGPPSTLIAGASKTRGNFQSHLVHKRHIQGAKQLRENEDIAIRRADKTAAFAIIPKQEYLTKMDNILADTSKFTKITRNPTEQIKKKINSVIDTINTSLSSPHFNKLTGDYSPGHAFGNVKTHKPNNPIRPIISQIPTATYSVAKRLNEILNPYVPHGLRSDISPRIPRNPKKCPCRRKSHYSIAGRRKSIHKHRR